VVSVVQINELIVHAVIGVYAFEQSITQPLSISLSFSLDLSVAAKQDALSDTVDYAAVCTAITNFVEKNPCRLLETLTHRLSQYLIAEFALKELSISITKKPKDILNLEGGVTVISRY